MLCQHDVTMTLFSRVFYKATTIEDFPSSLHQTINTDSRGRFYEDFYRYEALSIAREMIFVFVKSNLSK
jgi:hypothetical protein